MKLTAETTVFSENAIQDKFAELVVDADSIRTEVSKKVGNDEIISRINQTAETVKIQASKVEIDGTATFNAIKSSADAAYDAKGSANAAETNAKKAIPTQVSQLTNDSGYQTETQVETTITGKGYQTASQVSTAVTNGTKDLAEKSSAIARSQRIYYRKTAVGAPAKNTTWLSTSGTGYDNWSLSIPQLTNGSTKYPYLYIAIQVQTVAQQAAGNSCTCSEVLLDETTTVIDGGNIITGSLSANAVDANSGTFNVANIPVLSSEKITVGSNSLTTVLNGKANSGAENTALSYITDIDSNNGITIKPINTGGNDYLQINSTSIDFFRGAGSNSAAVSVMSLSDSVFRMGTASGNHSTIDTNGLHIWAGAESTASNEVALFSATARIGKTNSSRFLIDTTKLQAYNSSNKLYFEVSSSGIKYGTDLSSTSTTTTVASTTYADNKASAAQTAAEATAQGYANTAEANASYSIEVKVIAINYTNSSATLVAVPYYQGNTTLPTLPNGANYSYQWYKGTTALSNTSTAPTISGATTATLVLGQGSDLEATYVCVISKP